MGVGEAILALGADERPASFDQFSSAIDPQWIADALAATDTASVRRRKLPAEHVVWLVIGMGLFRDRSIAQVVHHLDLVVPTPTGAPRPVPNPAIVQARGQPGAPHPPPPPPPPRLRPPRPPPPARPPAPPPPLGRARPPRAHRPHAGRRPALRPRRCPRRVAPQPGDLCQASRPAPHAPRPRRPRPAPRLPPLLALHLAPQPRHPPRYGARRPLPRALGTRTRLRRTQDAHLRTRRNAAQQSARPRGARSLGPVAGLQPRPPRHEPLGAARPRAPGAPELSLRPPRRPGLLARRVGHVPRHPPSATRGVARRARALRAPRAPAPSLSPRRQDQDEQLSAESSPSPEIPCKATGIVASAASTCSCALRRAG